MRKGRTSQDYKGEKEEKECLMHLFYIAIGNVKEFVNYGIEYRKEIVKKLKNIKNNEQMKNLKANEVNNLVHLDRLIFNALVSFDAFEGYIWEDIENIKHNELREIVNELKKLEHISVINSNNYINLYTFLHKARNKFLHRGKIIINAVCLDSGDGKSVVPTLAFKIIDIFDEEELKNNDINKDCCIDILEVFMKLYKHLENIKSFINEII